MAVRPASGHSAPGMRHPGTCTPAGWGVPGGSRGVRVGVLGWRAWGGGVAGLLGLLRSGTDRTLPPRTTAGTRSPMSCRRVVLGILLALPSGWTWLSSGSLWWSSLAGVRVL